MADRFGSQPFFDTFRRRPRPLLSESEKKGMGLLDDFLGMLPAAQQTADSTQAGFLQGAGYLPVPEKADPATGAVPYITPERLKARLLQQQAAAQQAEIQNRYDESMDNALFRVADTLADTGRFFLSPLLFLGGFNFDNYDPSAQRRAGFRGELGALSTQQNAMVDYLIKARDDRSKTLREIQEEARQAGLPVSSEMKALRDFAMQTGRMAEFSSGDPRVLAALEDEFLIQQGKKFAVGDSVLNEKQFDTLNSANDKFSKAVVGYREAYEGYERLMRALDVSSGVSDIAVIFSFMKSLDPRSVVREGEFQVAANAGGLWDRLTVLQKKVEEGRFLSDDVRADIQAVATALMESYAGSYSDLRTSTINRTSFLTGVSGADVERTLNVPLQLFTNQPPPPPPPPPPGMNDDNELKSAMTDDED